MDVLRSCYRTSMRFYPNGPAIPVLWFFVPEPAKLFEEPTIFRSAIWDEDRRYGPDDGQPGEVGGAIRSWSNGAYVGIGQLNFERPAGPEGYWTYGPSSEVFLPLELNLVGAPLECGAPAGGPQPINPPCLPKPASSVLLLIVEQETGHTPELLGEFLMLWDPVVQGWGVNFPVGDNVVAYVLGCSFFLPQTLVFNVQWNPPTPQQGDAAFPSPDQPLSLSAIVTLSEPWMWNSIRITITEVAP